MSLKKYNFNMASWRGKRFDYCIVARDFLGSYVNFLWFFIE